MVRTAKFLIHLCLASVVLQGCNSSGGDEKSTKKSYNHHVLVFVDKSVSVGQSDSLRQAYFPGIKKALTRLLDEKLTTKGDRAHIHVMHEETRSAQPVFQFTEEEPLPSYAGMGPQDRKEADDDYKESLQQHRERILRKITNTLDEPVATKVQYQTDVLGSLEVLSYFAQSAQPADSLHVVYISDMVHSQAQPRDYHKQPLKDKAEAEAAAASDAAWAVQHYQINTASLDRARIHIGFTTGTFQQSNAENMWYYWQKLFHSINPKAAVVRL